MIFDVITTEQADNDLRGIYEYIAFELLSPDNAAGQLERLDKHIMGLEEFPERHRLYDKEPWRSRDWRWMPVDNYMVFYVVEKAKRQVTVTRVMYEGRNIEEQIDMN